jgi:molybdopterin converting factor small subunit
VSVRVNIFYPGLRDYLYNQDQIDVAGGTIGECLDDLIKKFPGAEKWLFNEQGQILENVFVYINAESARKADLSDPITEGDELIIAMLLIGG